MSRQKNVTSCFYSFRRRTCARKDFAITDPFPVCFCSQSININRQFIVSEGRQRGWLSLRLRLLERILETCVQTVNNRFYERLWRRGSGRLNAVIQWLSYTTNIFWDRHVLIRHPRSSCITRMYIFLSSVCISVHMWQCYTCFGFRLLSPLHFPSTSILLYMPLLPKTKLRIRYNSVYNNRTQQNDSKLENRMK